MLVAMHSYIPSSVWILLVFSFLGTTISAQQCYFPDGSPSASTDVPCNASAQYSSCCNSQAMCISNGLCFRDGRTARVSCTDPKWGPSCPQYCKNNDPSGYSAVVPCDDSLTYYTCGTNNTNCQTRADLFTMTDATGFMLRTEQLAGSNASALIVQPSSIVTLAENAVSSGATQATVTVTASASGAASAHTNTSATYTSADIAGAAAGTGIPLLLALAGAVWVIFSQRRKLRARDAAASSGSSHQQLHQPTGDESYGLSHYPAHAEPHKQSLSYDGSTAYSPPTKYYPVSRSPPPPSTSPFQQSQPMQDVARHSSPGLGELSQGQQTSELDGTPK